VAFTASCIVPASTDLLQLSAVDPVPTWYTHSTYTARSKMRVQVRSGLAVCVERMQVVSTMICVHRSRR